MISRGELCPVAVHTVFLDKSIHTTELIAPTIRSWEEVVENPYIENGFSYLIPGILQHYDLPDLEKFLEKKIYYK